MDNLELPFLRWARKYSCTYRNADKLDMGVGMEPAQINQAVIWSFVWIHQGSKLTWRWYTEGGWTEDGQTDVNIERAI